MKDGAMKACIGMVCVTATYGFYVMSNAMVGQPIPDGVILSGVIGAVCALGGYSVAITRQTAGKGS